MKPMLAAKEAKPELRFPCFASAKIDGIRAVVKEGILLSRTLIPIPNHYTQDLFGSDDLEGLDGELAVGPANATDLMQRCQSELMSRDGEPQVTYWIFDYWTDVHARYDDRRIRLQAAENGKYIGAESKRPRVRLLPQYFVENMESLNQLESEMLAEGYEGIMTRCPEGLYKYGRSTPKEQYLVKHKRFADGEAVVIGFEERMHNTNEAVLDERGYSKRSSHQENLVGTGMLGAFLCMDPETKVEFKVSAGRTTNPQRKWLWEHRLSVLGKTIVYLHFAASGVKDKPRFNVFKAFRDARDIGEPK
jgi:DNA ligase-1